jgi:hypothetical protein
MSYLFAKPSFLEGIARIFDFSGSLNQYNSGLTPEQSDYLVIRSDWEAVGNDLRSAIGAFDKTLPPELQSRRRALSNRRKRRARV